MPTTFDSSRRADVLIVGAGVAGICLAGHLAPHAHVLLLEREAAVAYHSSGRSAALYIEPYSNLPVYALTRGSRDFLLQPPDGFSEVSLARLRGALTLAPAGQEAELDAFLWQWHSLCPGIHEIEAARALADVPVLIEDYVRRAVYDPDVYALDTDAMLQGWLRVLRRHGGAVVTAAEVSHLERVNGEWRLQTPHGTFSAPVVVNAAGAWAAALGSMAGARTLPLVPHRRTAALIEAPPGHAVDGWPTVADAAHTFYFKPEAGALMLSPADATPTEPGDARPEEWDLALAVARAEEAARLGVKRFVATWAGLRTFVPDQVPVLGFDDQAPGFYWAAGQGGTGFQTAPAAGRWMAAEICGAPAPEDLRELGLTFEALSPRRFG
ncbi:MAG: FAD-binding oxidoreductase [Gammaproteobacteria bacterium]|nr:FAD-binding oxidoreductase [Gammaproteobacteria bacterium]